MSTITSTSSGSTAVSGLASGIDTASIIAALVEVDTLPLTLVQQKQSVVEDHLAAIQTMNTDLLATKTSLESLASSSSLSAFKSKSASVSDTGALTATASSSAKNGTYNISVSQLATAHQIASSAQDSSTTEFGSSGDITLMTASGDAITVTPDDYSLEGIADAINGSGAGISASVVNDGSAYRLLLSADETGEANAITQVTGSDDLASVLGSSGIDGFTETVAAQDAEFRIGDSENGLLITSASNTVNDAISGLTLTLSDTADDITVTVGIDADGITDAISSFVDNYNTAMSYFNSNSTYDSDTNTAGLLFSDSTLRVQLQSLNGAMSTIVSSQPDGYQSLEDIGISVASDGSLSFDSSVLQQKLSDDPDSVASLLAAVGATVDKRLDWLTDSQSGTLSLEENQLSGQISDMDDRITDLKQRIADRKAYYQAQFDAMEEMISELNTQSEALDAFLNADS